MKRYFIFDQHISSAQKGTLQDCQSIANELVTTGEFELLLIGREVPSCHQIQVMQHVYKEGYKFLGKGPLVSLPRELCAITESPLRIRDA